MASDLTASVRETTEGGNGQGAVTVVELAGLLDGAAADTMDRAYRTAATDGAEALVLDFGAVTYINSTGIALVVGLLGQARADGVEVRVCGLSDHYRHIFEITRLADFLTFFDDERAAVAAARST